MVMRRILDMAVEALEEASGAPTRSRSERPVLYDLSSFSADERFRPPPLPEAPAGGEVRPVQRQLEVTITQTRRSRRRRAAIRELLSTTGGVQQALILQEIVGPPKSLRPWDEEFQ